MFFITLNYHFKGINFVDYFGSCARSFMINKSFFPRNSPSKIIVFFFFCERCACLHHTTGALMLWIFVPFRLFQCFVVHFVRAPERLLLKCFVLLSVIAYRTWSIKICTHIMTRLFIIVYHFSQNLFSLLLGCITYGICTMFWINCRVFVRSSVLMQSQKDELFCLWRSWNSECIFIDRTLKSFW